MITIVERFRAVVAAQRTVTAWNGAFISQSMMTRRRQPPFPYFCTASLEKCGSTEYVVKKRSDGRMWPPFLGTTDHRSFPPRTRLFGTKDGTTSTDSISPTNNKSSSKTTSGAIDFVSPPMAFRDESRFVLAGKLDSDSLLLRQSETSTEPLLDPPIKVPDPYGWLRSDDRSSSAVLQHLALENEYTKSITSSLENLRSQLYEEMIGTIQETDYTTPAKDGHFLYYTRTFQGLSYKAYCRAPIHHKSNSDDTDAMITSWNGQADEPIFPNEQCYLDVNLLAQNKSYCAVGMVTISPTHTKVAYTVDSTGGETCQLFVKSINGDNQVIVDHDPTLECDGMVLWGSSDHVLFYMTMDETHRPFRVYRRYIHNDNSNNEEQKSREDELLFEETNELYWVSIYKSKDKRYLFIESESKETSEIHYLDLMDPESKLSCIAPRREGVLYSVQHRNGSWLITTNIGGTPNMKLMMSPVVAAPHSPPSMDSWVMLRENDGQQILFDGGYDRALDYVFPFQNHLVASGREGGIPRLWILSLKDSSGDNKEEDSTNIVTNCTRLEFPEDAHDVGLGTNREYNTSTIVVEYDSLITPLQSIEINLFDVNERKILKEKIVPGYRKELYGCKRIHVKSRDGQTDIPVSMVYRKDVMDSWEKSQSNNKDHDGPPLTVPVHLYGYGSYGAPMEDSFRATRLPLLNRGMIYVTAHVRGGGELGRQWYEEPNGAKYLCKKNTFDDFIDVARWLTCDNNEYPLTTPNQLSCEGRSAGGLLIGASLNQDPELFHVALLGVPFVDVLCTMIDATIPLTVAEWVEWGNPNEVKYFEYMSEYSPMNNVQRGKRYPACLLTCGLHDPRVQYWEPVKFAAELRHAQLEKSDDNDGDEKSTVHHCPICVKIDMEAGHFSASDRYKYLRELSFDYAFLLDQLGQADSYNNKNEKLC